MASSKAASAGSEPRQVDLSSLPIQQLNHLVQQIEQEIEFFTNSLNQLKIAQTKFMESEESLGHVNPQSKGKTILVPLSSSMYVPGEVSDVDSVLVDIGTGYYVDMTPTKAKEYFGRKIEFITKQLEKIQGLLQEKYKTKAVVVETLQMKVQQQLAGSQPAVSS